MQPLERPHRRLQHELEHEGEPHRQHDLGRDITGGKHCQQKETAQKHRLDIRRHRQIIFVGSRNSNGGGDRGVVSGLAACKQPHLIYRRHPLILVAPYDRRGDSWQLLG